MSADGLGGEDDNPDIFRNRWPDLPAVFIEFDAVGPRSANVSVDTGEQTPAPSAPQQQRRRRDRGGEGAVQSEQRRSDTQQRRSERSDAPVVTGSTQ